jgi:hypothetical protein
MGPTPAMRPRTALIALKATGKMKARSSGGCGRAVHQVVWSSYQLMGYATIEMTMRYSHLPPKARESAGAGVCWVSGWRRRESNPHQGGSKTLSRSRCYRLTP